MPFKRIKNKKTPIPQYNFEDVVFNAWSNGIADNPRIGNGDMRNCDNSRFGFLKISNVLKRFSPSAASVTFTADAGTDQLTLSATLRFPSGYSATPRAFTVSTTGVLPAGLSAGTTYFAIDVDSTHIKVATTLANAEAGTAVNITDAGSGTHTLITIDPNIIKHWAYDSSYGIYAVDAAGRVWQSDGVHLKLITGNTLTAASGGGIVIWKGYLIVFRNNLIDVMSIATGTWSNSWASLSTTGQTEHFPIKGIDDTIYFVDGRYVGSLAEATGTFDPTSAPTYTYTAQALDLPTGVIGCALTEIGKLLLVHTSNDTVYPWDRVSSTYNDPLDIPARGIYAAITVEDLCYVLAGKNNGIPIFYVTNGAATKFLREFPRSLYNIGSVLSIQVAAIAYYNNRILFGVNSGFSNTGGGVCSGIYSIDLTTRAIQMDRKLSNGYGTSSGIIIYTVFMPQNVLMTSWYNSNTTEYGVDNDYIDNFAKYGSYEAYVETDMRAVGLKNIPRPFKQLEITLDKVMASADGVKVAYRTDLGSTFTDFFTFDYATFGAQNSIIVPFLLTTNDVQLKVSLTGTAGAVGSGQDLDSVGLREVRLK